MAAQQPWTGIQVETSFFPLSFFLYLCTPTIVIDGVAHRRPWGTHSFQLEGGMHTVRIFFGYLFMSNCGDNSIKVVVQPNCISPDQVRDAALDVLERLDQRTAAIHLCQAMKDFSCEVTTPPSSHLLCRLPSSACGQLPQTEQLTGQGGQPRGLPRDALQ